MITAKNLQKAGFMGFGKEGNRDFELIVRGGDKCDSVKIVVDERHWSIESAYLYLEDDYILLSLTTVTDLLTLAKLLK